MATRTVADQPIPSRRFQPGHDGTGRDGVHTAPTQMRAVPDPEMVRHARRVPAHETAARSVEEKNLVHPGSTRWLHPPGATSSGLISDGQHVGTATRSTDSNLCRHLRTSREATQD